MEFLNSIKALIPDYAKDIRLNIDGTIARSSLEGNDAVGVALAAAFAAKSRKIIDIIQASGALSAEETHAALTASALMGMNNIWYPYLEMADDADLKTQPAQLRMNAYATNGGVDKRRFELYALAASIVGKCHFCVKSHFELLKKEGMSSTQLRDVGRIAAVINAAAQVIAASADH
jgi:alkyl hydroperoxide reductase subunit D